MSQPVEPGRIASARVYSGRVFALDVDQVRYPDGSSGEMAVVRHPGASAVLPVLQAGEDPEVLLIRQYRYATGGYLLEVPAGRLDGDESPEACARRELTEETGYTAARVEPLLSLFTTPGFTDERIHLFVASGLTAGDAARESDEFLDLVPMRLSRALALVGKGEIQDAKTCLALLHFAAARTG